jgi:hypothetical protein
MEVGLLFIDEEGIGHPDVLDELGSNWQGLDARTLSERKPRVRPELTEVEIQCEVLRVKEEQMGGRGVSRVWQPPLRSGAKSAAVAKQKTLSVLELNYHTLSWLSCKELSWPRHQKRGIMVGNRTNNR